MARRPAVSPASPSVVQWDEEPVSLDTFICDRRYLGNPPLSLIQFEAVRHAERIFFPGTYTQLALSDDPAIAAYWNQPCPMVNYIVCEWGKGGGKDHTARMISLRIVYLLLCLPSPQTYYGMPEQDTIHLLNVASSAPQASRAFFTPMTRVVKRGWFRDRASPTRDTIIYPKNVEAISGHSDAETQEGLNLILGVADEIDAFKTQEETEKHAGVRARESTRSAEGIIAMLRTSASTRFPEIYKNVYISYPRYKGSTIQVLVDKGRRDNETHGETSRYFTSGPLATWEVNPRVQRPCPDHQRYAQGCRACWAASKATFQEDYDEDPLFAAAKYECNPSHAINPYFSNEIAVTSCMTPVERQPLEVSYIRDGQAWQPVYDFAPSLVPIRGAQYAMHADLAVKGDRAGVVLAHVKSWRDVVVVGYDERGAEVPVSQSRPVVKVDFAIGYEADSGAQPPREIQIRWARDLCLELRKMGFNIRRFTADGYQSTDTLQILELQQGMETDRVSTDRDEGLWRTLRDLFSEGRVEMSLHELARRELLGLSKLPNGKVDHMPGGSKDLADALAGAVDGAILLGGAEEQDSHGRSQQAFLAGVAELPPLPLPLPLGFVDPSDFKPGVLMDHLVPMELDGMGRPVFSGGVFDFGEAEHHQG